MLVIPLLGPEGFLIFIHVVAKKWVALVIAATSVVQLGTPLAF